MTRPRSHLSSLLILLVLVGVLSGCATGPDTARRDLWRYHLGVRPDEPEIKTGAITCTEYKDYSVYAQRLQEAYHSRATHNRVWIYVAAILGLGVAAASGGLAAATAVGAGTLGLLAVSGGFSAAAFATIDNSELAQIYTISANRVDRALKEADAQRSVAEDGKRNVDITCAQALRTLREGVSEARTNLELSRTNTAAGALARAKVQQTALKELIESVEAGDPTRVTLSADITDVQPPMQGAPPAPGAANPSTQVKLSVKNIRLDQVAQADVKVLLGTKELPLDGLEQAGSDNAYKVTFTAPAAQPDPVTKIYSPILLVGKTKQRVMSQQVKTFTYQ